MVIAVTLCLLMLFMVIAEYFRVNIIVQGVRDAVQQAVIATVNENYDDVYHSVREGYAAGSRRGTASGSSPLTPVTSTATCPIFLALPKMAKAT